MYTVIEQQAFKLVGLSVRTVNADGQATRDIAQLAADFFGDDFPDEIPNRIDNYVCLVYTDYEHDQDAHYTAYIGCRVASYEGVDAALKQKDIAGGTFALFKPLTQELDEVMGIWSQIGRGLDGLSRRFDADYNVNTEDGIEVYLSIHRQDNMVFF